MLSSRRWKPLALIAGVVLAGAGLLSATMTWFTVRLHGGEAAQAVIVVPGDAAAPAIAALSVAALALVAALAIAGPVFRVVLAALEALIGVALVVSAVAALSDPLGSASPLVTEATGISGRESLAAAIESSATSAWPVIAVIVGILLIALGAVIVLSSRAWPGASRRYQAARPLAGEETRSPAADWDSLSDGEDPTGAPEPR